MVSRFLLVMAVAIACASSASAQSNTVREKLASAADRACVLATQLSQLCGALQNDRTKFNVQRLMGAVCKPGRADKRVAIEKRYFATFGSSGDLYSCSARADAFKRLGAEMRSIATAVEEQRPTSDMPTS